MRLGELVGRWVGKVEVVLAGADDDLRDGEEALSTGNPMRARAAAHRVLARAPDSPLGLALLADACEMADLDAELALTLEDLARRTASRAEVWVRLGRARHATNASPDDVRDAFVRALAVAESGSEPRREALIALADLDLANGDGARAELWLERAAGDTSAEVALRRAEARLLQGDAAGALARIDGIASAATDGRAALVRGRALAAKGDAAAYPPLLRAAVLDVRGASEALSATLAWVPSDDATRARVRSIVDAKGESDLARWRAAFARAAGQRDEARAALRDAVTSGDAAAAGPLLDAAIDDRDRDALLLALDALRIEDPSSRDRVSAASDARRLPSSDAVADPARAAAVFDELGAIDDPRVVPWADAITRDVARTLVPASGAPGAWPELLARLDTHARSVSDLEALARVADLASERGRPVRVAIVGEFNAGKSTFINAMIGADVAPTGVLPTTATLHHLRYAPDPIARILLSSASPSEGRTKERIVPLGDLRATLKSLQAADPDGTPIRRVEILLPLASLTRVEILDTPGFNAPDARHTKAARAAFEEADAAIWLLDAAQAMKQTERAILEEAKSARLPVQLLVNKADRLAPEDLAKVMTEVVASLDEVGLKSWSPPIALSARKALAGRLGDAAALEASGWIAVQALLDEQIVGRDEELKERAMRRRAAQIVARLRERASTAADADRAASESAATRAHAVSQAAARIERDAEESAVRLAASLGTAGAAWERDLAVVFTGRDADTVAGDHVLARYRVDRALAHLATPLANALASIAPEAAIAPAALLPLARAIVRGAVAAQPDADAVALPIARAAIASLVDHLFALAVAQPQARRAAGLLRELAALEAALASSS